MKVQDRLGHPLQVGDCILTDRLNGTYRLQSFQARGIYNSACTIKSMGPGTTFHTAISCVLATYSYGQAPVDRVFELRAAVKQTCDRCLYLFECLAAGETNFQELTS